MTVDPRTMYPTTPASAPAVAAPTQASAGEGSAQLLYPSMKDAPASSTEMYDRAGHFNDSMFREVFRNDIETSPEKKAEFKSNVIALAVDIGLEPAELEHALVMGRSLRVSPRTAEQVKTAADESAQRLRETYGPGAEQALADARKFVKANPKLHALLDGGLGNDPRTVLAVTALARSAKAKGRL